MSTVRNPRYFDLVKKTNNMNYLDFRNIKLELKNILHHDIEVEKVEEIIDEILYIRFHPKMAKLKSVTYIKYVDSIIKLIQKYNIHTPKIHELKQSTLKSLNK